MIRTLPLVAAVLLLAFLSARGSPPPAAAPPAAPRIAVVELFRVLAESKALGAKEDEIRRWIDRQKAQLEERARKLDAMEAELELFAGEGGERRERRLELARARLEYQYDFEALDEERRRRIRDNQLAAWAEVRRVVAEYAEAQGYDLVLHRRSPELSGRAQEEITSEIFLRDLLYVRPSLDITPAVLSILDG